METHRRTDIENNMASAGINVRFAVQYEAWISSGSAGCRPVKGTAILGGQDARVVHTDYLPTFAYLHAMTETFMVPDGAATVRTV